MVKIVTYILENDTIIQGLVGDRSTEDGHKVFPVVIPQSEAAPFIAVRQLSRIILAKGCDYEFLIQVSTYAGTYDSLDDICPAIIEALTSEQPGTVNGATLGSIYYEDQSDLDYDKDHGVYGRSTIFKVIAGGETS